MMKAPVTERLSFYSGVYFRHSRWRYENVSRNVASTGTPWSKRRLVLFL